MFVRKLLAIGCLALMLPAASLGLSTSASAGWLVRGYPLHLRYYHVYHRGYFVRRSAPYSGGGGGCCPNSMLVCPLGRHFC